MAGIADLLKRHASELDDLTGSHADSFLALLGDLKDTLTGRLTASGNMSNPLDVWRLRSVLKETEAQIAQLEARAGKLYDKAALEAAELSTEHIANELESMAEKFGGSLPNVSLSAAKVLSDPMQPLLAEQFETSVGRYGDELLQGVRQRLFVGIRAGDSVGDVVKDISGERGPLGEVGKANAERLVRTEISESYGSAHAIGFKHAKRKIPDLAEYWVHIGSYPCKVCNPLHGTRRPNAGYWTITQGFKTRKVVHPPAHPNCACRLVTMRPGWRQGFESAGYLEKQSKEEQPTL